MHPPTHALHTIARSPVHKAEIVNLQPHLHLHLPTSPILLQTLQNRKTCTPHHPFPLFPSPTSPAHAIIRHLKRGQLSNLALRNFQRPIQPSSFFLFIP